MISGNEKMATNTRPLQFSMNFEQMCSYPEIKEMLDSARRFLQNHKPFQPSTPQSLWFEHVLLFQNMAKLCSYLASSRSSPGYLPAEPEFQNPHPVSRNNVTAWMEEGPWNPLTVGSRTAEDTEACSPTIGTATNFPAAVASSTAQNFFSTSDTLNITQPSVPTPPLPPQYCHSTVTTATLRRGEADSLRYTDTMVKTRRPGVAFGSKSLQLPSSQQSPMTPRTSSPLSGIKEHESIDLEHLQGGQNGSASIAVGREIKKRRTEKGGDTQAAQEASPSLENGSGRDNSANRARFSCKFCGKEFEFEWKYNDHQTKHTKKKQYQCESCQAWFGRERDLIKHRQSQKHQKRVNQGIGARIPERYQATRSQFPQAGRGQGSYYTTSQTYPKADRRPMDIPENNPSERRSSNATQMSNSPSPLPRGGQLAHTLFWPAEETFPNVSESHGPNEADKSRELSLNPPVVTLSYIASPSTPNLLTGSSLAVSQQNLVYPFTLNMHDSNLPWFPERDNASEVPGDEPAFFPQFVNFAFSQSSQPSSSQPSSSQPSSSSYLRSSDMRSIGNTTTESTTGPETTPRLASAYSYYGTGAADGSDGGQG